MKYNHCSENVDCPDILVGRKVIGFSHLCIGHTRLTYCYSMNGEGTPKCVACDCGLTVEIILIEYQDFDEVRQIYYGVEDIKQLIKDNSILLLEIELFIRI